DALARRRRLVINGGEPIVERGQTDRPKQRTGRSSDQRRAGQGVGETGSRIEGSDEKCQHDDRGEGDAWPHRAAGRSDVWALGPCESTRDDRWRKGGGEG